MTKNRFILGIDTGGTYTDAAVIDAATHRILASAKSITTKGDLSIGVGNSMGAAVGKLEGRVRAEDIRLVCVSTTLATNRSERPADTSKTLSGHAGASHFCGAGASRMWRRCSRAFWRSPTARGTTTLTT